MTSPFGFDTSLYQQVRQYWLYEHDQDQREIQSHHIPELEDFATLIDIAFESSIRQYEGNHVRFSLALCAKEYQPSKESRAFTGGAVLTLKQAVPLSPNTVTTLGAAMDVNRAALLVAPARLDVPSHIWGVSFLQPGRNANTDVPFELSVRTVPGDMLIVTVVAPGSLLIGRGEQPIGQVVFGQFTPIAPTPLKDGRAMGRFLLQCVEQTEGYRRAGMQYWRLYTDVLESLFRSIADHGCGGTLIILPPEEWHECQTDCVMSHEFEGELGIASIMRYAVDPDSVLPSERRWWISQVEYPALRERIAFLGRLTAMDGAVFLSCDLEPVAVGVKLRAPQWQGEVRLGPDGTGSHGDLFDVHEYGTRHTSAVDFVGKYAQVAAFVVSQDGPIRGFMRADDQTVLCWPDSLDNNS